MGDSGIGQQWGSGHNGRGRVMVQRTIESDDLCVVRMADMQNQVYTSELIGGHTHIVETGRMPHNRKALVSCYKSQ
jgi:hypothetical protein